MGLVRVLRLAGIAEHADQGGVVDHHVALQAAHRLLRDPAEECFDAPGRTRLSSDGAGARTARGTGEELGRPAARAVAPDGLELLVQDRGEHARIRAPEQHGLEHRRVERARVGEFGLADGGDQDRPVNGQAGPDGRGEIVASTPATAQDEHRRGDSLVAPGQDVGPDPAALEVAVPVDDQDVDVGAHVVDRQRPPIVVGLDLYPRVVDVGLVQLLLWDQAPGGAGGHPDPQWPGARRARSGSSAVPADVGRLPGSVRRATTQRRTDRQVERRPTDAPMKCSAIAINTPQQTPGAWSRTRSRMMDQIETPPLADAKHLVPNP